jgi:gamma-glutamyltranspeptidase
MKMKNCSFCPKVYILNILKHFNIGPKDENPLMYHRVAEAFKWAYAQRSKLGDPFDPEITTFVNEVRFFV